MTMTTATKKAPDVLEHGEGEDQNPTIKKETDMSIVDDTAQITENTAALRVREPQMLPSNRAAYTPEELAFAKQEETERLETWYIRVEDPRREGFATPDGHTFRNAGSAYLRTCRDGVRRFVAYTHDDSTQHDFQVLDEAIGDAKHGRMEGWRRHTFKDGDEGWIFHYPNYRLDSLKVEPQPAVIIDKWSWGYPCTEPLCREKYHENEDGFHIREVLEDHPTSRGSYEIEICKDATEPDSAWYLNFWTNGDLTDLTPEQVAKLANDLNWMSIECETTNAKESKRLRRSSDVDAELRERDV